MTMRQELYGWWTGDALKELAHPIHPTSYAWRAWWEMQVPIPRMEWPKLDEVLFRRKVKEWQHCSDEKVSVGITTLTE